MHAQMSSSFFFQKLNVALTAFQLMTGSSYLSSTAWKLGFLRTPSRFLSRRICGRCGGELLGTGATQPGTCHLAHAARARAAAEARPTQPPTHLVVVVKPGSHGAFQGLEALVGLCGRGGCSARECPSTASALARTPQAPGPARQLRAPPAHPAPHLAQHGVAAGHVVLRDLVDGGDAAEVVAHVVAWLQGEDVLKVNEGGLRQWVCQARGRA